MRRERVKDWLALINDSIAKALGYFYDNQRLMYGLTLLGFAFIAVGMYYLNKHTMMIVDDYGYSFSWVTGKRIGSLYDIYVSQYKHYFSWGGRSVVHCLAQFFLMFDKQIFNIANTAAYIGIIIVTYLHMVGSTKLYPALLLLINFAFFSFMPAFGQVFLWIVGACNYLWGPLLTFAYLLPFRFQLTRSDDVIANKLLAVVFGLLGIICAWTNENLGVTIVCLVALVNIFYYHQHKHFCFWGLCGLIGVTIGAALLILAPGNYVRLHSFTHLSYLHNFVVVTKLFLAPNFLLLPLAATAICFVLGKKQLDYKVLGFYLSGLLLSMYAMVGAPYYADRSKLGSLLFCLILLGYLYTKLELTDLRSRKVCCVILLVLTVMSLKDFNTGRKDILAYEGREKAKIAYALQEKEAGRADVIVPHNYPTTKYCAAWGLEDINKDPKHWTCTPFARYHGLSSVRTK